MEEAPLNLFRHCEVNSSNNVGTYILLDSLFLPNGSMPALQFPRDDDCMAIKIEDGEGNKLQMNCYGGVIDVLRRIPRNSVIHIGNFVLGNRSVPPMYAETSEDHYGYINQNGFIASRGPQDNEVYRLSEVKAYLGRFTLELVRIDDTEHKGNCWYKNTFWMTTDRKEVMITAYGEKIRNLEDFQLVLNGVYSICNAVPYPNSIYPREFQVDAHFTIGPATTIDELQI